jgi:prepilin-type N-terminal cleavage/methylation domain-containing protein
MRKENGFTLLELMVVLAIVVVTLSIGVPNFISWMPKRRLQQAAGEVQSLVRLAQLTAVKEGADVVVNFYPAGDACSAFVDNGAGAGTAGNGLVDGDEKTLPHKDLPPGIDLTATGFSGNQFRFNSRGLASASGSVTLKNKRNESKIVDVNIIGASRIH